MTPFFKFATQNINLLGILKKTSCETQIEVLNVLFFEPLSKIFDLQ